MKKFTTFLARKVGFFTFGPFRIRFNANIIRKAVQLGYDESGVNTGDVDIDIFLKTTKWQMMIGKTAVGSLSWF